jgi:hypothetical protein
MSYNLPYIGGFPSKTIYIYPPNPNNYGFSDEPFVHQSGSILFRDISDLKHGLSSLLLYLLERHGCKSGTYLAKTAYEDWEYMEEYPPRPAIINLEEWEVTCL